VCVWSCFIASSSDWEGGGVVKPKLSQLWPDIEGRRHIKVPKSCLIIGQDLWKFLSNFGTCIPNFKMFQTENHLTSLRAKQHF
jgi:hypothetical protein